MTCSSFLVLAALVVVTGIERLPVYYRAPVEATDLVTDFLFAPVAPGTVRLFRALLAAFAIDAFWPRSFVPVHPAHWAAGLVALVVFGVGFRPRLSGLLAFAVLLPLGFLDLGQASRQLLLFALLATSLWSGPGPIWPLRLIQIQLSVVYGVNAVAKSTSHYLSGDALVGLSAAFPTSSPTSPTATGTSDRSPCR